MPLHSQSLDFPSFRAPSVSRAAEWIREHDTETIDLQVAVTEVPAPPFHEAERGRWMAERLAERGVTDIRSDEVGNVIGWLAGVSGPHPLVVSAHLDTVFPPETDCTVTRDGDTLRGPGISDDGRGLAALLALAGAFHATGLKPERPILLVCTVGEEGLGDLRGVKHLFREDGGLREVEGFISLDGAGVRRIVASGIGSVRFRATVRGQGGHSWVDFGTPNPIHALADMVAGWTALELPHDPASTLTVARTGGGKSINAIPEEAWVEVDIRSEDPRVLERLHSDAVAVAEKVIRKHSRDRPGSQALAVDFAMLGRRPAGSCPRHSVLLRASLQATRAVGIEPKTVGSSTDANVPMSLGIPALTLGAGGDAGLAHTHDEWYRNDNGPEGIVRALLTLVGVAGVVAEPESDTPTRGAAD